MKYSFILLSAGKGMRFGNSVPKQYLTLAGKPMIVHILENIDKIEDVEEVLIVCHPDYEETIKKYVLEYMISKKIIYVYGGETRQESVYNGLLKATYENVILHEAARPLVSVEDFKKIIDCSHENVSYTYSIPYTVLKKSQNSYISDILNRSELVNIQLPQKFAKAELLCAHEHARREGKTFTEDAGLLHQYSQAFIYCLDGKSYNIKITEHSDLLFAETLYKEELLKESL